MIKIKNNSLAGFLVSCYNPSLVCFQGKTLLFYRFNYFSSDNIDGYTNVGYVELDPKKLQPISKHKLIPLPAITKQRTTFDDPRAFVWRNELWLMYIQSVKTVSGKWSSAIVLSQISLEGNVIQTHVPNYGYNFNRAVSENAKRALEKNWSPLVIGNDLYMVYEINPLHIIKFQPANNTWIKVSCNSWTSNYKSYLSGSTPLIPWLGSEYIGVFHTFEIIDSIRTYSMGFYTVDINTWRITHISSKPVLTAKVGLFKKRFRNFIRKFWFSKYSNEWLRNFLASYKDNLNVIFPCGIINYDKNWAVSIGYDHYTCGIKIYNKVKICEDFSDI